ncbi:MAG: hypothetical protein KDA96_04155 [Planctomycetaceae bacterium]|nr:hypothetical protein [Planctomycetaceae bacterium]
MRFLGLDIGGANLKVATADGASCDVPFEMWRRHREVTDELRRICTGVFAQPELVALTMTAELADCFESRSDGVRQIVQSVAAAFPGTPIRVWMTSGEFAEPADAVELPELVAASNWHALATWAGRAVPIGPAILVDTGSTTTDIIPLIDGYPVPEGHMDLTRLISRELVYSGVRRTPVCAIVQGVAVSNGDGGSVSVPVAAELFATSLDAHLVTDGIGSDPTRTDTADGRPATKNYALARLAHQLCCDENDLTPEQLVEVAQQIVQAQQLQIRNAVEVVSQRLKQQFHADPDDGVDDQVMWILSGSGVFLMERILQEQEVASARILKLKDMTRCQILNAECAFAVARLAAERCLDDVLPLSPWA